MPDFPELSAALTLAASGAEVRSDSRRVGPGDVFVALPAAKAEGGGAGTADGAAYVADALSRGAAFAVVQADAALAPEAAADERVLRTPDARAALGALAAARYRTAGRELRIIGVTGTNGKTTVTYLLEKLLTEAGATVGVIGTIEQRRPGWRTDAALTTPDCLSLHALLAEFADAGVTDVVMEVSSHALDQDRVAGIEFTASVFTNLTRDHLDYHGDMRGYFFAKAKLFLDQPSLSKPNVINVDDNAGREYVRMCDERGRLAVAYSLTHSDLMFKRKALRGTVERMDAKGLEMIVEWDNRPMRVVSPMIGRFNAHNLLAAIGCYLALGEDPRHLLSLKTFHGAPGRLERVETPTGLDVFVDYAHTPDAVENVLKALRGLEFNRIVTVFGCGGDRDRTKRPLMGQAAANLSDVVVVTSDNPRTEDPAAIIAEIMPGVEKARREPEVHVEPDRAAAIRLALSLARPGDAVIVAGKGHEDYQIIGKEKRSFSDAAVIRETFGMAR